MLSQCKYLSKTWRKVYEGELTVSLVKDRVIVLPISTLTPARSDLFKDWLGWGFWLCVFFSSAHLGKDGNCTSERSRGKALCLASVYPLCLTLFGQNAYKCLG